MAGTWNRERMDPSPQRDRMDPNPQRDRMDPNPLKDTNAHSIMARRGRIRIAVMCEWRQALYGLVASYMLKAHLTVLHPPHC